MPVADMQLLTATSVFMKLNGQTKGNHNVSILNEMKILSGEIAHKCLMTSSEPGIIHQIVGFITSRKFHWTSFFVDNRSDYTFACHQ